MSIPRASAGVGLSILRRALPIARNYGGALVVRGVEVVGKLGLYIVAAQALGARDAGYFFLCITWMNLLSTTARLAFDRAMTRHIAAELAIGQGRAARHALLSGLGWATLGAALASLLTLAVAGPVSHYVFGEPDLAPALALSAILLLPQTWVVCVGAGLAGFKRGAAAQIVQNALWPVLAFAAILAGVHSLELILWISAGAMMLATLLGLGLLLRERHQLVDRPAPEGLKIEKLQALWRTALPLSVVEIIQVSISSVPLLVLGVFASPEDVGAFSVATRISLLVWVLTVSIGTVASPLFAEHHRRHEIDRLRATNRLVRLAVAVCGLPAILLMLVVPGWLLSLIGPEFAIASTALMILAIGQAFICAMPCQDTVLAMTGHGPVLRKVSLAQLVLCLTLCAVLIPWLGMLGAAILTAACNVLGAAATTLAVRRYLPGAF